MEPPMEQGPDVFVGFGVLKGSKCRVEEVWVY